ncbi:hypothetical protein [Neptunomonas sp.]|uniref:hypothetical protein n=1 Tax=Neptunomonas sp. TaxID=1971898 RepID=UPI0025F00257|nr:hypothetical protein [Neptunomonas sp.]
MSYIPPVGDAVDFEFNLDASIEPTYHAWVRGLISKYDEPIALKVTALAALGSPKVLGEAISDPLTGLYEIDIAPHVGEVLLMATMDYGVEWLPSMLIQNVGEVIHPPAPNRYIYVSLTPGMCGSVEPNWPTTGNVTSGDVIFKAQPLFEPLAGGYLKPTIEPK